MASTLENVTVTGLVLAILYQAPDFYITKNQLTSGIVICAILTFYTRRIEGLLSVDRALDSVRFNRKLSIRIITNRIYSKKMDHLFLDFEHRSNEYDYAGRNK